MLHIAITLGPQMGRKAMDAAAPHQRCFALPRATLAVGVTFMPLMACTLAMSSTSSGCAASMHEGYSRSPSAGIGLPTEKPGAVWAKRDGAGWPTSYPPSVRDTRAVEFGVLTKSCVALPAVTEPFAAQ